MPPHPDDFSGALVLTGPTGSGKSALALQIAERLDAEIISLDSMTVYRGMDIGTAKPSAEERHRVTHHLIDVLDPWESADVAWYLDQAKRSVDDIQRRGKQPLFVGGTPFYLKAMLFGLFESPPVDEELRRQLEVDASDRGPDLLHARLAAVDPESAARLHPNDVRRVIRALEVFELTGQKLSIQQQEWSANRPPPQPDRILCLDWPREVLYDRINRRVTGMIEAGWLDEVQRVWTVEKPPGREAAQALGYQELHRHLQGEIDLATAIDTIQRRSRNFAKRQLTWFRNLPGVTFLSPELTLERWTGRMNGATPSAATPRTAQ